VCKTSDNPFDAIYNALVALDFQDKFYRTDIGRQNMPEVVIIAGSKSDNDLVAPALELAETLGINVEYQVYSAHRDLENLLKLSGQLQKEGKTRVIIAVAGLAAALPGVVAARVDIPVIGVPCNVGP
jgi:phosphoribosylcarboxyaminoimidazole (NCAIR) mutase